MPTNSTTPPSNGQVQTRTRQRQPARQRQAPPPAAAAAATAPAANSQTNLEKLSAEAAALQLGERVSIAELQRRANNQSPATSHPSPLQGSFAQQRQQRGVGPRVSDLFPTRWIHPDDLQGKTVNVFIEKVTIEKLWSAFDKEHVEKIVLFFHGKSKQLPLNVTQAQALVTITGSDFVMSWAGHGCRLRAATARNGKPTIEILPPLPAQTAHTAAAADVAAAAAAAGVTPAADAAAQATGAADLPDDEPPADDEEIEYIDDEELDALFGE